MFKNMLNLSHFGLVDRYESKTMTTSIGQYADLVIKYRFKILIFFPTFRMFFYGGEGVHGDYFQI